MTSHAALVVASAVAAVAAGRVELSFNLVQGDEIAAVLELSVGAVAVFQGRLHFNLVGVAVIAEGTLVAGGTKPVVRRGVEAMILDEGRGVAERIESLHGALLLVYMAFGAVYLLSDGQRFGMRSGKAREAFHPGAGGYYTDESGQCQEREQQLADFHFFPPVPV